MDETYKVWLIICILSGPLLAALLPHNIGILIIDLYLLGVFVIVLTGGPDRRWKYG